MYPDLQPAQPREGMIPVENARLYYREIGQGQPILVLHGGPDFDHTYLLPDMDRLSDTFRLIYYDQRGRGKSAENVQPEDVTLRSEIEDMESIREYFRLESIALLGHSWGGLLAMEYALHYARRVSHLILMNTAPASTADYLTFRQYREQTAPADMEKLKSRTSDPKYLEGDPDTVARYYRIHYSSTLKRPEHLDKVIASLRASFTKDGILQARAIEDRLMEETWLSGEYNLLPRLKEHQIPTLVIYGEHDFVPLECAMHVVEAIPGARFVSLKDCGHFSYLEQPEAVHREINNFFLTENTSS